MKSKEQLHELSDKDLMERLETEKMELNQLSINHTITPLDQPTSIKSKRRNIARIHTELRAREMKKA